MQTNIHPTALVPASAQLDTGVTIEPYAILSPQCKIGKNTRIHAHAQILGDVQIGQNTHIGNGSIIGGNPQDIGFDTNTPSGVSIAEDCVLREHVTVHRATKEGATTVLEKNVYLMVGAHVGHDSHVDASAILANSVMLGGFVTIGERVFIGGGAGIHQNLHIGALAMIGGNARISQNVPPYLMVNERNEIYGLNRVGLRRAGWSAEERKEIKTAYEFIYFSGKNITQALEESQNTHWFPKTNTFLHFFQNLGNKGFCKPSSS